MYVCWKIFNFFLPLSLPGYSIEHHNKLLEVFRSALAPRTWRNKMSQVNQYIGFCHQHDVKDFEPMVYDLLSFLLFLSDRVASPGTIMNYFSAVRLWVTANNPGAEAFLAHEVKLIKRAIYKLSTHIQNKPLPSLRHSSRR